MASESYTFVKRSPGSYPHQEGLTCGEFNAKGVIEGFRVSYRPPATQPLRIRIFGYSFIQDISKLLAAHGVSAPVRFAAHLSSEQKLSTIRRHIDEDRPVIIAIGNGHLRRGYYSPLARMFIGHFITVYGYSSVDDRFLIYDPYLEGSYPEEIPVGNEVRTAREMLRDWSGPIYYKLIRMDHVYIPAGAQGA